MSLGELAEALQEAQTKEGWRFMVATSLRTVSNSRESISPSSAGEWGEGGDSGRVVMVRFTMMLIMVSIMGMT